MCTKVEGFWAPGELQIISVGMLLPTFFFIMPFDIILLWPIMPPDIIFKSGMFWRVWNFGVVPRRVRRDFAV